MFSIVWQCSAYKLYLALSNVKHIFPTGWPLAIPSPITSASSRHVAPYRMPYRNPQSNNKKSLPSCTTVLDDGSKSKDVIQGGEPLPEPYLIY